MTYRFLEPQEFYKVAPAFIETGCEIPPQMRIWAGEEDGEIASFQCVHQVCHLGPVWVRPDRRGQGLWAPMQRALERRLGKGFGFYQFGTEKNESQLKRLGLTPLGWKVWIKKVTA